MSSIWNAFQVYNKSKHSKDPDLLGMNHSNIGSGNTSYMYAKEYRPTKNKSEEDGNASDSSRRSSISEDNGDNKTPASIEPISNMVDISNMTQSEFQKTYDKLRKGEPNNRVNF